MDAKGRARDPRRTRAAGASGLVLTIGFAACSAPARGPMGPEVVLDADPDRRVASVSFPRTIHPGTHVVRFRGTCRTCTRLYFHATLQVDGAARPPISVRLVLDGEVVAAHDAGTRCSEDDVGPPRPPTCTLRVGRGWDRLDQPTTGTHLFDVVIANEGPAVDARLFATLMDPHE